MIQTLDQYGLKHGTDKASSGHDYLRIYERLMSRNLPVRLLEIGVHTGASLRTWEEWLSFDSVILGIDIDPRPEALGLPFITADATQPDIIDHIAVVAGSDPWDFIIDDGSHQSPDVIQSFELLWPLVAPGGFYIVEDLQVAYLPEWKGRNEPYGPDLSSMHYLKHLTDEVHRGHAGAGPTFTRRTIAGDVASVAFYPGLCVVEKQN